MMKRLWPALVLLCLVACASSDPIPEKKSNNYVSFENPVKLGEYLRWTPDRTPLLAAHRGGPVPGFPENCIESFENSLTYAPCLIECDVRRTSDSVLVLMHDDDLDRTTTGDGPVEDHTLAEIRALRLVDNDGQPTDYIVPTLEEALEWARDRSVLELDVKWPVTFEEVIDGVREGTAENRSVIITYNVDDAVRLNRLAPDLMISAPAGGVEALDRLLASSIPPENLLGWVGTREPPAEIYKALHDRGIRAILGTLGNLDRRAESRGPQVYTEFLDRGADILATDNVPLAAEALHH